MSIATFAGPDAIDRAYRILCAESNTPEWLRLRKSGIGASEAAAILGDTAWGTPRSIYDAKRSDAIEDIGTDLMEFGHLAEPLIESFMLAHPERYRFIGEIMPGEGLLQSIEWPWLLGTLDRRVRTPQGFDVPLEMKSVNDFAAREWWEGGEEDDDLFGDGPGRGSRVIVPRKYQVQVQQQMAVIGAPFAYVAVWLGKTRLEVVRVERDDAFIQEFLVDKLGAFWNTNVAQGIAPPLTFEDDLWAVHPGVRGQQIVATPDILDVVGLFREAKVDAKRIEEQLKGVKAKAATKKAPAVEWQAGLAFLIAEFMGDATELVHPDTGEVIHTLRGQNTARRVDMTLLENDFPEVYEAVVGEPGWTRVHRGTEAAVYVD